MFSDIRLEERVPAGRPLREVRVLTDEVLAALDERFDWMYSLMGRPGVAPEMLLRANLLQAFFSVRSERQRMEQIDGNLLFRWFAGLPTRAAIWHPTVFSPNRDRLMAADVAREFLAALMGLAQVKALLPGEPFSVDGTLIAAWASMITLGADKACDVTDFAGDLRARKVTPHIAVNGKCPSWARPEKPPSTRRQPATPAMPSANAAASASRKSSVGSRPQQALHRSKSAANPAWTPPSPSPSPPAT